MYQFFSLLNKYFRQFSLKIFIIFLIFGVIIVISNFYSIFNEGFIIINIKILVIFTIVNLYVFVGLKTLFTCSENLGYKNSN